jgi:hypothetical protein
MIPSNEEPLAAGRFRIHGRDDSRASLTVQRHDAAARSARALKTLGITWGCAVIAVFLPLLHFVLVPLLLLGGPVLAYQKSREAVTLLTATGACPACQAPQDHRLNAAARERLVLRCESCGRALELWPDAQLLAPLANPSPKA